jgi:hypothetical protein
MSITFPNSPSHGAISEYRGITYTFNDGNSGNGAVGTGGWWEIGTVGSYGSCTGEEIDQGVETIKYATPYAIAQSSMVKEQADGVTSLTFDGTTKLFSYAGGIRVVGALITDTLSVSNLNVPGSLSAGSILTQNSMLIAHDTSASTSYSLTNTVAGAALSVSDAGDTYLISTDAASSNGEVIFIYNRGAGITMAFNNSARIETTAEGANLTGSLTATGSVSASGGTFSGAVSSGLGLSVDVGLGTVNNTDSSLTLNNVLGYSKLSEDQGILSLTKYDIDGSNPKRKITASTSVELYYNDIEKFKTTSGGASVLGGLEASADININSLADGSRVLVSGPSGGGYLRNSEGDLQLGTVGVSNAGDLPAIFAERNKGVSLYYNGQANFTTVSGGSVQSGNSHSASLSTPWLTVASNNGRIDGTGKRIELRSTGTGDGRISVANSLGGAYMLASNAGRASFGRTNATADVTDIGMAVYLGGQVTIFGDDNAVINTNANGGTLVGTWSGSLTSDPTVKKDVVPRNGIDNILALNGVDWNWITPADHDESAPRSGFLADNYQAVYPDKVAEKPCDMEVWKVANAGLLLGEDALTQEEFDAEAMAECDGSTLHEGKLQIVSTMGDKTFDADLVESIKYLHAEMIELKDSLDSAYIEIELLKEEL